MGGHLYRSFSVRPSLHHHSETSTPMSTLSSPKQAALQLVERLDDDVSFEDIIYELYVLEKIQRGMKDAEEGQVLSHEEAGERLKRWLK